MKVKGRPARPEETPKFSGPPENYCVDSDGTVWCRACVKSSGNSKEHVRSQDHLKRLQWMADEAASA
eukprot:2462207-Lingulodinium_polyedra.AAC.1